MSATLNSIALDVVGQYGVAGKNIVNAYRVGAQRLATTINERYSAAIQSSSLPLFNESIRNSLVTAQNQFAGLVVAGVTRATERADVAIDRLTDTTAQGLKTLNTVGQKVEALVGTPVVETLTKLNMPAAQLSLQIAGTVVEGTKRLADSVAPAAEVVIVEADADATAKAAKRAVKA